MAATTLLLLQISFVLQTPDVAGGLRLMCWIIGSISAVAFGFALFGRWPGEAADNGVEHRADRARLRSHGRAFGRAAGRTLAGGLLLGGPVAGVAPARADTSTIGRTWAIAEPDALGEIEAKVATLPRDLRAHYGPRARWSAMHAATLAVAPADRVRTVVPFHTLEFDITLPDGRVLYPKGFTFNPLAFAALPQRLVVVHPRDLSWALRTARPADFILLTAGDAIAESERTGRAIYILEERVKARLGLTVAPVVVSQSGQKLVLNEYGPLGLRFRPAAGAAR